MTAAEEHGHTHEVLEHPGSFSSPNILMDWLVRGGRPRGQAKGAGQGGGAYRRNLCTSVSTQQLTLGPGLVWRAGKFAERDLPDYSGRNWDERAFTIGIGGCVFFPSSTSSSTSLYN